MLTRLNTIVVLFYGIVALIFMGWAFFYGPNKLPKWKWQIIGFICAAFVSALGVVVTGEIALQVDPKLGLLKGLGIQATGGAAFFCITIIVWLRYANHTESDSPGTKLIEGRVAITETSKLLMRHAELSISIFGGDGSWVDSHADLLKQKLAENVEVRMLCLFNEQSKPNFLKAKDLGISITPYPAATNLKPLAGQIIDDQTLFFVNKRPKNIGHSVYSGVEGSDAIYHYTASTIDAERNPQLFHFIRELFNLLHNHVEGQAFHPNNNPNVIIQRMESASFIKALKGIDAYSSADIKYEAVQIKQLKPLRSYVDIKRVYSIRMMDARLSTESLDLGNFITAESPSGVRSIFPPIIERHKDTLYVIDGTHRLYYSLLRGRNSERCIVIENVGIPLPASPSSWEDVELCIGSAHSKTNGYKELKVEYWRKLEIAGVTQNICEVY